MINFSICICNCGFSSAFVQLKTASAGVRMHSTLHINILVKVAILQLQA